MPPARRSARATSTHQQQHPYRTADRANTRRSPAPASARPSATIARPSNGKLKLTVKAPPSKLRQATSGSQPGGTNSIPPNPYADAPSESDATPQPAATRAQRSTRNPRTVVEPESDEDDDEDAEGEEEADEEVDADVEGDLDQELLANEDSEEDAEGEDDEELDDSMLDSHPPPPIIKQQPPPVKGCKPNVTVTAPSEGPLKSVEAKEMGMDDDDDDELSELDENDVNEMENEVDDDEDDNTDDDDPDNSRSATPDLSKLTRRQRGHFEDDVVGLMALSNEAQKKKHLTAEEHATRRAEMARRRKNLSDKRNEEEKVRFNLSIDVPLDEPLSKQTDNTSLISYYSWTRSTSFSRSPRRNAARARR